MGLPKIEYPLFDVKIPSSGKVVKMRPMVVKEEKILLMAKESSDPADVLSSVKQVVNNCLVDDINVDDLYLVDVEYLFVKLRAQSISATTKASYRDKEDNLVRDFDIDLNNVEVKGLDEKVKNTISVTKDIIIEMKYPRAALYSDQEFMQAEGDDIIDMLIKHSISKIYNGDSVVSIENTTTEELHEFLDSLNVNTYNEIRSFLQKMPSLYYEIKYTNDKGTERKIVLSTLNDFFSLM